MSLCMWTKAMHVYSRVAKLVEPKEGAQAAEDALAETMAQLKEKQDKLKAVQDIAAALEASPGRDGRAAVPQGSGGAHRQRLARGEAHPGLADEQVLERDGG